MLVLTFLAQPVKEGSNAAIVQRYGQEYQNGIKRTHKYKMACIVHPVKNKWKHGKSPFLPNLKWI